MNSILKEREYVTIGVETESVEKLLTHIALQTKSIANKLTININEHIAKDLQNYTNETSKTLEALEASQGKTRVK